MRKPVVIFTVYMLLALATIPWYWGWIAGAELIVCGLPMWVASALVGSAFVSCYTGWLLSQRWAIEENDGVDL